MSLIFRIGIGSDTHRLVEGRRLIIGGVQIPSVRGGAGHSDADPLLHAITDAILGALCKGDIGQHFSDSDPQWRDADSRLLLEKVAFWARDEGWRVVNVDSTVMLESPRLMPHIVAMREKIAGTLSVNLECVSVKAKTGEAVDAVGEGLAVSAQAVVLLES